MSAFQCNITPTRNRVERKRNEDREPTFVDLKPFSAKAIVTFDGIPMTKEARRLIIVSNPFDEEIKVTLTKVPKPEYNITIEWSINKIPPQSHKNLELIWNPRKVVSCREVIQLCDDGGNKKDIAIILKSCELQKTTSRKIAPVSYTKTLKLKPPSPPTSFQQSSNRKSWKNPPAAPQSMLSPLRNANIIHQHDLYQRKTLAPTANPALDKENSSPLTPRNASSLFDNIRFTPITETKSKCESKLEYLASLPTPVGLSREDIILSESAPRRKLVVDGASPDVHGLSNQQTPQRNPRDVIIVETITEIEIDEIEIVLDDPSTAVFSKTRVISATTPLGAISEEGPLAAVTQFHKTFKVNESQSLPDISTDNVRASESMRETCLIVPDIHVQKLRSNQGSMPNLNDINAAMGTIEQNRYYLQPAQTEHQQNLSLDSLASHTDFRETEICAQSSRLFLNDLISPSKPCPVNKTKLIQEAQLCANSPAKNSLHASPTVRRVQREPDFKSPPRKTPAIAMTFSPPAHNKMSSEIREFKYRDAFDDMTKGRRIRATTWKQQQNNNMFVVPRVPRDLHLKPSNLISQSLNSLSSTSVASINSTCSVPTTLTSGRLYNENYNVYNRKDPFSATITNDPFLSSTMYLDEQTLDSIEKSYKKWLNALVTIPPDLETDKNEKIDVGKLFSDVQNKELTLAPTKEVVCSRYYTSRLDLLRTTAVQFFHSPAISTPLNKITVIINDKNKLDINPERNIHLDLVLQRSLLELLLCYNPLWLRIGLEVIFNVQLNLSSNQDIYGMSRFIITNLFKSQYLAEKYSKFSQQREYLDKLRKFTAKNFLFIIFFLDRAKEHRLIKQNPCLFVKKAPYKESGEILKKFASLVLANYGDIFRTLRRFDYTLTHKQTVIDEFNFAFQNLGVDLRDGVRLTKVMEIILMRDDLVQRVRVPAISRLQKVHNVDLALRALEAANYQILGNITSKDIADGHREKTLSLLWQIIYKFRAPRFNSAAETIQRFWRSKYLMVLINRRIREKEERKRHNAATVIQKFYRGWNTRQEVKTYREKFTVSCIVIQKYIRRFIVRKTLQKKVQAATLIQSWYRRRIEVRIVRTHYLLQRRSAIVIQSWWRRRILIKKLEASSIVIKSIKKEAEVRYRSAVVIQRTLKSFALHAKLHAIIGALVNHNRKVNVKNQSAAKIQSLFRMKRERTKFIKIRTTTIVVQRWWKHKIEGRNQRKAFLEMKTSAIVIQKWFRGVLETKEKRMEFVLYRSCVIKVQQQFRATKLMKKEHKAYIDLKSAASTIQERFRANSLMKSQQADYQTLKHATVVIQQHFKANLAMRVQRTEFLTIKQSCIVVQRKLRATIQMKQEQAGFLELKSAAKVMQTRYRAQLAMRAEKLKFDALKKAAVSIQRRFRAQREMKKEHELFQALRAAAIKIQQRFRATQLMNKERGHYQQLKKLTIYIQQRFRSIKVMRKLTMQFYNTQYYTVVVQQRFRANRLMKSARSDFVNLKEASIVIQRQHRANLEMKQSRERFVKLKSSSITIQRKFRATLKARKERSEFLALKSAAIIIQQQFKANKIGAEKRVEFLKLKKSVCIVETRFKAKCETRQARSEFLLLKTSAVSIQQKLRATLLARKQRTEFLQLKSAAVTIQQRFRAKNIGELKRNEYLALKKAVGVIETRYEAKCQMERARSKFLQLKANTITIQQKLRATLLMRQQLAQFKLVCTSVITIQRYFRGYRSMKLERSRFQQLKSSALTVQRRFRARRTMKVERASYLQLKSSVIKIQHRFRANQSMKAQRNKFILMKTATVLIQNKFRATLLMRREQNDFQRMKSAVVVIQRKLRATLEMKIHQTEYQRLRQSVLNIQRRFRANKLMAAERRSFLTQREAAVFVQRRFRWKQEARKLRHAFVVTRTVVVKIQTRVRGYLARKRFAEMKTPERLELHKKHKAARTIQAAYRGYSERSKNCNRCFKVIVQRLVKASKNVNPAQTLAAKLKTSIDFLKDSYDSNLAISFLAKLEYISRIVPWMLVDDAEFVAIFCCGLMGQAIRSEIDKQIIELCSCIILNLSRYKDTKEVAFQEYGLTTISQMLLRWCDKDCGIFNTLCTLVWVFAHCDTKRNLIRNFMMKDGEFIISQIKQNVSRKENMRRNSRRQIGFQSISLVKYKRDYQQQLRFQPQATVYSSGFITPEMLQQCREMPSLQPDYGVVKTKPYIFYSSVFAFDNVLSKLNIRSD